jgi:hypothetical protein
VSSTDRDVTLTPPEPEAPVPRERAGGLVPVDGAVRAGLAARAAAYVEGPAAPDARSPEFAGKVGDITALGAGGTRPATAQSHRMPDRGRAQDAPEGGLA